MSFLLYLCFLFVVRLLLRIFIIPLSARRLVVLCWSFLIFVDRVALLVVMYSRRGGRGGGGDRLLLLVYRGGR
jgi:hypothetical protein